MSTSTKPIGIIGVGDMGKSLGLRLHKAGFSLILYNRTEDKYEPFRGMENVQLSTDKQDFVKRLHQSEGNSVVWLMIKGGTDTNNLVAELSTMLGKGDIVLDCANAFYEHSVANHARMKEHGIFYLDVGCGGGPSDILKGVPLMVGGDKEAFDAAEGVIKAAARKGKYDYVGKSGAGQVAKGVHNLGFYFMFPGLSEMVKLLERIGEAEPEKEIDVKKILKLYESCAPINGEIVAALSKAVRQGKLPKDAPTLKVSEIVKWTAERAEALGLNMDFTQAVLNKYDSMDPETAKRYGAAKKIVTGH